MRRRRRLTTEELAKFIADYMDKYGKSPTIRQMCDGLLAPMHAVAYNINLLASMHYIEPSLVGGKQWAFTNKGLAYLEDLKR